MPGRSLLYTTNLLVTDNPGTPPPENFPTTAVTIDGPLWIAVAQDLWALNPENGRIETKPDVHNSISSMSTDPTGSVLYAGGQGQSGPGVTEYNARNGEEIVRSVAPIDSPTTVSADSNGVWVSFLGGHAGGAEELSRSTLSIIAPPAGEQALGEPYDQFGGVGTWVGDVFCG